VTVDRGEVAVDLASLNALVSRALVGHSNLRSMEIRSMRTAACDRKAL
jgi:hypothetical protein